MTKTLATRFHTAPSLAKILLWIAFFLGVFVATFRFISADNIPFEDSLTTMFTWLNTGNYSNTYFRFGGNDFVGIIFRQTGEHLTTPQNITINAWAQSISCSTHLRGIYYNNQRGRRIWPLDTGNLAILSAQWSGYGSMTLTNWFFTDCVAVSWSYIPQSNEVYGQIDHDLWTQTFRMIAWVDYNFTGNAVLMGTSFARTLTIATWWIYTGSMFDTNWGIAEININTPWCQNFTSSPSAQPIVIPQGSDMSFTCYGNNVTWYVLGIAYSWSTIPFFTGSVLSTNNSYTRITWSALATGDYLATCTVLWPMGVWPQCWTQIPFHVGSTWTVGCNPNFQGEITFSSLSGSIVTNPSLGTYFTNRTGITLQIGVSEPAQYSISGDFVGTPLLGTFMGSSLFTPSPLAITLNNSNTRNNFASIYTTWACTYTDAAKRVYVDTVTPTAPSIVALSGTYLCPSTPLTITRSASTDSGAWLSHYTYGIYTNTWMITGNVLSGTVPNTITSVPLNVASLPLWTYYMRVQAVDNVGMVISSNIITFTLNTQYCTTSWTGVVIVTPTIWLRNVDLDKVYRSDPIIVLGLTWPTLVSVSKWMLFINNGTGIWTTGIITSQDTIYIEVVSSNLYDTTISSNLSILGLTWTFSVTTKKSNCVLSAAEKLVIQNIYANLKDEYNDDLSKYSDFLNTFQSMVEDESDISNSCTLEYLLSLIKDEFWSDWGIDTSNHITPNCKEYSIGYDSAQKAYYAPEMTNRYYFINRESLIRHLDYYNPGDCHINTYGTNFWTSNTSDTMNHIAPNGKIYHFIEQYGWFSASEFTSSKYFDSLQSIIRYVDLRNPPKEIWKHTINTAFTPITYAAPNGKEYKIYRTDRWYMSYKLMKVRYYETLSELKTHISKNNPSKR